MPTSVDQSLFIQGLVQKYLGLTALSPPALETESASRFGSANRHLGLAREPPRCRGSQETSSSSDVTRYGALNPNNLSLATCRYLEKYRLLDEADTGPSISKNPAPRRPRHKILGSVSQQRSCKNSTPACGPSHTSSSETECMPEAGWKLRPGAASLTGPSPSFFIGSPDSSSAPSSTASLNSTSSSLSSRLFFVPSSKASTIRGPGLREETDSTLYGELDELSGLEGSLPSSSQPAWPAVGLASELGSPVLNGLCLEAPPFPCLEETLLGQTNHENVVIGEENADGVRAASKVITTTHSEPVIEYRLRNSNNEYAVSASQEDSTRPILDLALLRQLPKLL
ncbi:unnamed protein product [Protopolystoma xenopodis]|uniref:Uncharacterized protein n=1 Tax=Protopolystoma xenopodis TaxID=117903 RepID=A0A3S5CH41_9PLAT|nr:unnamed protein product [Protopolystoma xenopodis]